VKRSADFHQFPVMVFIDIQHNCLQYVKLQQFIPVAEQNRNEMLFFTLAQYGRICTQNISTNSAKTLQPQNIKKRYPYLSITLHNAPHL